MKRFAKLACAAALALGLSAVAGAEAPVGANAPTADRCCPTRRERVLQEHPLLGAHGDHHRRRDAGEDHGRRRPRLGQGPRRVHQSRGPGHPLPQLEKNLWMYFPKEQDTVPISGHLLKDGMMGSDISYEDSLESQDFRIKYTAAIKGEESVEGRPCAILEIAAKVPTAAYDRRIIWVDEERWVALKEEMYAKSGKLLKTSATLEVKSFGGRWYPVRSEYVSKLRKDTKTLIVMSALELDPKLDPNKFTMAALKK